MTKIRLFSGLMPSIVFVSGLLVLFLAACTPAASPVVTSQPVSGLSPTSVQKTTTPVSTESAAPTLLPIATSRGPELHATDPATVSLASGGLQLVEFFRFT